MKDVIHVNGGVFKKRGLPCFALLNVNNNKLFLFDSDVEILWDMLDESSLNELHEKLIDIGYEIGKGELFFL